MKNNERQQELVEAAMKNLDACIKTGLALYWELTEHGQILYFIDYKADSCLEGYIPYLGKYEFIILPGGSIASRCDLEVGLLYDPFLDSDIPIN